MDEAPLGKMKQSHTTTSMKKILLTLLIAFSATLNLRAESEFEYEAYRNEVRLTMGDPFFESLIWHNDTHGDLHNQIDDFSIFLERQRCAWTPHFAIEYDFRLYNWLSLGAQVDYQYTSWHVLGYNNQNMILSDKRENFYNLSFIPKARFTYLFHEYINLYSGIGVGININGGSEVDLHGKNTVVAPVIDLTVLGIKAGYNRWYGLFEIGGLTSLKDDETIYMLFSKLFTLGAGYVF